MQVLPKTIIHLPALLPNATVPIYLFGKLNKDSSLLIHCAK